MFKKKRQEKKRHFLHKNIEKKKLKGYDMQILVLPFSFDAITFLKIFQSLIAIYCTFC